MRQIVAPLIVLALVFGPVSMDVLAKRRDACAVAPCCAGKMSKACPMHAHPERNGFGIRSCGPDEGTAVAHQVLAVLAIPVEERAASAQRLPTIHLVTPSHPETTPPDPPPPRALTS